MRNEECDEVIKPGGREGEEKTVQDDGPYCSKHARDDCPAKQAIDEVMGRETRRGRGRPQANLLNTIRSDLKKMDRIWEEVKTMERTAYCNLCDETQIKLNK